MTRPRDVRTKKGLDRVPTRSSILQPLAGGRVNSIRFYSLSMKLVVLPLPLMIGSKAMK